jgi:hypothetical protein
MTRKLVLLLIFTVTLASLSVTNVSAYSGYESGCYITLGIPNEYTDTSSEDACKMTFMVNPTTSGLSSTEGDFKLGLNIYSRGVGGAYSEGNFKLYLVPEQAFVSYTYAITANDPPWLYTHTDVGVAVDIEISDPSEIAPLLPGTDLNNSIVITVNVTDNTPENAVDDAYTDITINVGALDVATCEVYKKGSGYLSEVLDITTLPTVKPPGEPAFSRNVANNTVTVRLYVGDPLLAVVLPRVFVTGEGTYPSISGTHNGTITPFRTINVSTLYTYPCSGTGGHTEYVKIWNSTTGWNVTAHWNGYIGDWHNLTFNNSFTLYANETYNYTISTGSYPQIIHESSWKAIGGIITCEEFVDLNGKRHEGWIPAIKLY